MSYYMFQPVPVGQRRGTTLGAFCLNATLARDLFQSCGLEIDASRVRGVRVFWLAWLEFKGVVRNVWSWGVSGGVRAGLSDLLPRYTLFAYLLPLVITYYLLGDILGDQNFIFF